MFRAVFCQNGDRMEGEGGISGFPNGEGLDAAGASPRPAGGVHKVCARSLLPAFPPLRKAQKAPPRGSFRI